MGLLAILIGNDVVDANLPVQIVRFLNTDLCLLWYGWKGGFDDFLDRATQLSLLFAHGGTSNATQILRHRWASEFSKIHDIPYRTEPGGFVALTERLANSGSGLWRMSTKPQPSIDYLSAERSKEWIVELSALLSQQIEALEEAAFITMNDEDAKEYEKRSKRIAELNAMLGRASRF